MDQTRKIVQGYVYGLRDSLVGILAIRHLRNNKPRPSRPGRDQPSALNKIASCCALNGGVFGASIIFFHYFMLPILYWTVSYILGRVGTEPGLVAKIWSWLQPILSSIFHALWVLPLFCICRLVNALWFQDIADSTFRGRPQSFQSIAKFVADNLFSVMTEALFLIQTMVVGFIPIPIIGYFATLFHLSLLYALYSFEYKWINLGLSLHQRLEYIESNWPYFFGFGTPLALMTTILTDNYFINGCIFSILFPLFIISGNEARPFRDSADISLRLFSIVVWISNKIVSTATYLCGHRMTTRAPYR